MFRKRNPQRDLFASSLLLPEGKAARLQRSWAEVFRRDALPLIDEESLSSLYSASLGRPNRPVQTVVGVLILKELFDLTDEGALEELEYNLQWHHALELTPEEAHLPQKTLHNFRARLLDHAKGRLVFEKITDGILSALGSKVAHQRLDSTHVMSNMARRSRLGLFCETLRVFLREVEKQEAALYELVPARLRGRYVRDEEEEEGGGYGDARSSDGRRRLEVCARDVYRLHTLFADTAAARLPGYGLLSRLLEEQCAVVAHDQGPDDDDDDAGEGRVPVFVVPASQVKSNSMQSPHDPDATYSGHKGQGYEVQVCETCDQANAAQIITQVETTDSCVSDQAATLPVLSALDERGHSPDDLLADAGYGSLANVDEAALKRTEVIAPVAGNAPPAGKIGSESFMAALTDEQGHCPGGQVPLACQAQQGNKVWLLFSEEACRECPLRAKCPSKWHGKSEAYRVNVDLSAIRNAYRRQEQRTERYRRRYALRAGIEATNSELKRAHGLGHLRVRGKPRVELAVYLKTAACNIKRFIGAIMSAPQALSAQVA